MSKTLETLVEKALRTGHSNINGRQRWYGYTGELQAFSELLLAVFSDCKELVYTFKLSNILPSYREAENWTFDGSDGCLYCSDCIHDHLEDEEEIA